MKTKEKPEEFEEKTQSWRNYTTRYKAGYNTMYSALMVQN